MVTNNSFNVSTAATGTVLAGQGVGVSPLFTANPSATSITLSGGTALSTYVEGTFTPSMAFGGGSTGITYTSRTGIYTQIGNIVFFAIVVFLSNKGSSTGAATVTGFPVASSGVGNVRGFFNVSNNVTYTAGYILLEYVASAGTAFGLFQYSDTANSIALTDTNCANLTNIRASGFYFI